VICFNCRHPAKDSAVTRESKLALILSFVLILVVGVLVSDYFSQASAMDPDRLEAQSRQPIAQLPGADRNRIDDAIDRVMPEESTQLAQRSAQQPGPVVIDNGSSRDDLAFNSAGHAGSLLNGLSNGFNRGIEDFQEAPALASPGQSNTIRGLGPIVHQSYTVREGDSLYQIALRSLGDGDRWTEIQSLNAGLIGSSGIINPGMKLRLPANARVSTPKTTPKPKAAAKNSETYTVASGDTLGEISMKVLGTSRRVDEFVKLNGLDDANDIRVGMKLKVPTN